LKEFFQIPSEKALIAAQLGIGLAQCFCGGFVKGFITLFLTMTMMATPAVAENRGLGLLILNALTRPKDDFNLKMICSDHKNNTAFSVAVFPQSGRYKIYAAVDSDIRQECSEISEREDFLNENPLVRSYIENALARAKEYQGADQLNFKLLFNSKISLNSKSFWDRMWDSFSMDAHAATNWDVTFVVSQKQNNMFEVVEESQFTISQ